MQTTGININGEEMEKFTLVKESNKSLNIHKDSEYREKTKSSIAAAKVYSTSIIFITIFMAILVNFADTDNSDNKSHEKNEEIYSKSINSGENNE